MKRIIFVIETLNVGGAEKSLVTLLQNIDFSRFEVDLMLFSKDGFFIKYVPANVNIIYNSFPKLSLIERVKFYISRNLKKHKVHNAQIYWNYVKTKFDEINQHYDIAIAYNQGFATYFVGKYVYAEKKISWINTDYKKAGYNIHLDIPFYKIYNTVITVSEEGKKVFLNEIDQFNLNIRVEVIKDISDPDVIKKQADKKIVEIFDSEKINIVSVGRLEKYKGFEMAIESCKLLIERGYRINWYLIGNGSQRSYLESLISKYEMKSNFHILPSKHNPYPYMKACDIYVQTSLFEGLGLTVIEAAILCKPIVSTNFTTVYSIIENEKTGLICNQNSDSIAYAIERLIYDKNLHNYIIDNLSKSDFEKFKIESLNSINNLLA